MTNYHKSVLLDECLEGLNLHEGGIYVDTTFGGGGHTRAILERSSNTFVYAFDTDPDAAENAKYFYEKYPDRFELIKDDYVNLRTQLALRKVKAIDGILFDLGISSHQINEADRGFSFMLDGDLDMRMNPDLELSAADLVNQFSLDELKKIIQEYGEEKDAYRIARAIVNARDNEEIKTTLQLAEIVEKAAHGKKKQKSKARVFQALRIYINSEITFLETALTDAVRILNPKGRIVVISYHSLEDRVTKRVFAYQEKDCICPPDFPMCVCNKHSYLKLLTKKPQLPTEEEISINSRARSAKLRIAERLEVL